jgi:hypothetical protein
MVGERDGAVGTGRDVAAGGTLHERRVSAAVEEKDRLLVRGEGFAEGALERFGDGATEGIARAGSLEAARGSWDARWEVCGVVGG